MTPGTPGMVMRVPSCILSGAHRCLNSASTGGDSPLTSSPGAAAWFLLLHHFPGAGRKRASGYSPSRQSAGCQCSSQVMQTSSGWSPMLREPLVSCSSLRALGVKQNCVRGYALLFWVILKSTVPSVPKQVLGTQGQACRILLNPGRTKGWAGRRHGTLHI